MFGTNLQTNDCLLLLLQSMSLNISSGDEILNQKEFEIIWGCCQVAPFCNLLLVGNSSVGPSSIFTSKKVESSHKKMWKFPWHELYQNAKRAIGIA